MNFTKLAQIFKKDDWVSVGLYDQLEDLWFITNKYLIVFTDNEGVQDFISKFNSYKSTTSFNFKELYRRQKYTVKEQGGFAECPDIESTIPEFKEISKLKKTRLEFNGHIILNVEDKKENNIVIVDEDYYNFLSGLHFYTDFSEKVSKYPLKIYSRKIGDQRYDDKSYLKAVLRPTNPKLKDFNNLKEKIINELN